MFFYNPAEVKPAINDLHVFNEKCVRWRAEKYEHDKEMYKVRQQISCWGLPLNA